MQFDFSGAELFLDYLAGRSDIQQVWLSPAYQILSQHASRYSNGLTAADIHRAAHEEASPFYGLSHLHERLPLIRKLLESIRQNQTAWIDTTCQALLRLDPGADIDHLTIFPVIGYDMGIGLNSCACLNCNHLAYLKKPDEFLYYLVHEGVHILYERRHAVPTLDEMNRSGRWQNWLDLWTQNEGFAVYGPLQLRQAQQAMDDPDYQVLDNPIRMTQHVQDFIAARRQLSQPGVNPEQALELLFGSARLTYRTGCYLVQRIEAEAGLPGVQRAFYQEPGEFIDEHFPCLAKSL